MHQAVIKLTSSYTPLSRYPGTERDICFKVASTVSYAQVVTSVTDALQGVALETSVNAVDIYQGDKDDTKNITVRISLTAHDRTLKGDEVTGIMQKVIDSVSADVNATVI